MRRRFLNNINKSISIDYHLEYFTIEALEDGLTAKLSTNACEYRIDNGNWTTLSAATNTPTVNSGEKIYFRGNLTPKSSSGIGTFTISKKCNVEGNIMSLLYGDDFGGQISLYRKNYAFKSLFQKCTTLKSAKNLILPATTLVVNCYYSMFYGCTSLTTAPELPATTLYTACYSNMFSGCTSLTRAPALPATTLALNCYNSMFNGTNVLPDCSNIDFTNEAVVASGGLRGLFAGTKVTDADLERILPKNHEDKYCLPATTLANNCYYSMFQGCTSLTTAPELPATTLAARCYQYMFYGCSKLNCIKMLATDISAGNCFTTWVYGVASSGIFIKHPNMTSLPSGTSGIPSGWTVVNDGETNLITFTIDGTEYQAEEGMTWEEWVNSEYNTGTFVCQSNNNYVSYQYNGRTTYVATGQYGGRVNKTSIIDPTKNYMYYSSAPASL